MRQSGYAVTVEPFYDSFKVHMIFDDGSNEKECSSKSRHVCAIDLDVNHFAAVTNNKSLPCLLFKGGTVKSINHLYNTRYVKIQSVQTKGTTDKFITTPEVKALSEKRDNILSDFMHKTAKRIIDWCIDNEIDTVVVGENKGWKQSVELGKVQNQNFVQIPYTRFKNILRYLCQLNSIIYITQEESYTSKASFLNNDEIPVYGDDGTITFSGKRRPSRYKGGTNRNGFRGIYRSKDGTYINADLNGSANIGRKAFPELYTVNSVNFTNPVIFRHPDLAVNI